MHASTHARTHARMHARTHAHTHTQAHTRTHTQAHTCTRTSQWLNMLRRYDYCTYIITYTRIHTQECMSLMHTHAHGQRKKDCRHIIPEIFSYSSLVPLNHKCYFLLKLTRLTGRSCGCGPRHQYQL